MRETTKIQRETEGHCQAWMTKGSIEKYGGTILRMFCQCFDMGLFPVVRQFRHFPSRFWTAQPFADGCLHQPFCCVLKRGKVGNHRVTTEESCSYWKKGGNPGNPSWYIPQSVSSFLGWTLMYRWGSGAYRLEPFASSYRRASHLESGS